MPHDDRPPPPCPALPARLPRAERLRVAAAAALLVPVSLALLAVQAAPLAALVRALLR